MAVVMVTLFFLKCFHLRKLLVLATGERSEPQGIPRGVGTTTKNSLNVK